jgi:hypothetical protein
MPLPTGLVPVAVFVLTAGIAIPVALGAHLFYRSGERSFRAALRIALIGVGSLYLVGVGVVWAVAGGLGQWEIAATLVLAGLGSSVVLTALPLLVGQWVVRRAGGADSEAALRYATYGWPVAMLAVVAVFVAPGGLAGGDLLALGGPPVCLAGHCGIPTWFGAAVLFELVLTLLGPGVVGLALYSSAVGGGARTASS